jgi:hypothetical protein
MKKIVITVTIFTLLMVSSAFAGDILGRHDLSNNRGLLTVKSIEGNKMTVDIIYVPENGKLMVLNNVFADYDSQTRKAVYSEDRYCPDALKMTFLKNGNVVLREAACAAF